MRHLARGVVLVLLAGAMLFAASPALAQIEQATIKVGGSMICEL